MPSIARNGPGSCAACRITRAVAPNRFQRAAPRGAAGVVGGICRLAAQAASATATIRPATAADPCRVAITMPAIVPRRIAIKVPASTSALPSSSSSGASRSGRIAYLSGPKNAATIPIVNSSASSTVALPARTPPAAASITGISMSLIWRIIDALSDSSAIWPAVAEHRKNGSMKSPAASGIMSCAENCPPASAR